MQSKIAITGHPYAFPYYFRVFDFADNKQDLIFILPKVWKSKTEIKLHHDSFKKYGLSVWSYGKNSFLGSIFKGWMPGIIYLLPILKFKQRVGILYSCSEPNLLSTLYNGIVAKLFGIKYVIFTWQNITPEKRLRGLKLKLSNFIVRLNLAFCDGVICGNQKAERIISDLKPKNSKLKTIVCPLSGVDTDKFKPEVQSDWNDKLKLSGKTILFYGALDKRKGLNDLIKAFGKLSDADATLVIVGKGPEKDNLLNLCDELNLQNRLTFIDWMDNTELPGLLCASDVFTYPSVPHGGWEEQFGYAMAEAGACEVPVISTNTGSIEEVVIDSITGILVPPNNPDALKNALEKLLNNETLRIEMGKRGREYVVSNFSHKIIAHKLEKFLISFL